MAWVVRLPDGTLSEPFETAADAEAYGEEVTAAGGVSPEEIWEAATSPRVDQPTFMRRMAMGWKPHRALHSSPDGRYLGVSRAGTTPPLKLAGHAAALHDVLGRKRTVREWAEGSGRTVDQLYKGIEKYGTLQNYFLNTGWYPGKPATPGDPDITDDRWSTP